ncbi:MAG: PEP-CTERM sorting domain-containing protein [Planctomycetota bacterium]|nr:MAG: PEP-CTERM sorting domain-containing protein [Planctomycetota bacterium]REJ89548.1 MAG: PEP-CTERM sorting domain-containing protein [Planctomycetota bacterium]REK31411.1 MAG: PEP-CTERM sorting domain-containing protein [Planctomycetota bacterium]REK40641.1 MAG: PEP-CTERM sorting domain-containing protein [Planctomycetota bacterium]
MNNAKMLLVAVAFFSLPASQTLGSLLYQDTVLGQSPLAYYQLDEQVGTVATDLVGTNHGSYGSALTLGDDGPRPPAFGGFGANNLAPQFDKDDFSSVINLPSSLGMSSSIGSVSMFFRITQDELDVGPSFLFYGNSHPTTGDGWGSANEHHVHLMPDGKRMALYIRGTESNTTLSVASEPSQGSYADGKWHHLAFTWDRNDAGDNAARIYVDGNDILSVAHDANSFGFSSIRIGRPNNTSYYGNDRIFGGRLDEVAVFNRVLSPMEVSGQYSAAIPEPASLVLSAIGLVGMSLYGWRRFRAQR